jgi:hypothetical protein
MPWVFGVLFCVVFFVSEVDAAVEEKSVAVYDTPKTSFTVPSFSRKVLP